MQKTEAERAAECFVEEIQGLIRSAATAADPFSSLIWSTMLMAKYRRDFYRVLAEQRIRVH
jgi:hypothetical protein